MAKGEISFNGGTFRENLIQYSKARAAVDPVYRADLNRAMAERRRTALEKTQAPIISVAAVQAEAA
jgi:hypothetical protein